MPSPTLTVRLNDELKDQMLSYPDTNWSAFVRMAIQKELERLQRSDASRLIEQVREKLPETTPPAVELVRAMRQANRTGKDVADEDDEGTAVEGTGPGADTKGSQAASAPDPAKMAGDPGSEAKEQDEDEDEQEEVRP